MEQHSHLATAMSAPMPRQSPTALSEQLQQREVARLLHALTRLRVAMAPLATVFLGVVVLFDPNTWKIWALSAVALMMIAIARAPLASQPTITFVRIDRLALIKIKDRPDFM